MELPGRLSVSIVLGVAAAALSLPCQAQVVLGGGIPMPSLAATQDGSSLTHILDSVRVSTGKFKFESASPLESKSGKISSVDFDLSRASASGSPLALSIYADYASGTSSYPNDAEYVRSSHAYGLSASMYLPSSLTKIVRPYAGIGIGKYQMSYEFRDPSFPIDASKTTKSVIGGKAYVGVEVANYVFLEAGIVRPGYGPLAGYQFSIGTRL